MKSKYWANKLPILSCPTSLAFSFKCFRILLILIYNKFQLSLAPVLARIVRKFSLGLDWPAISDKCKALKPPLHHQKLCSRLTLVTYKRSMLCQKPVRIFFCQLLKRVFSDLQGTTMPTILTLDYPPLTAKFTVSYSVFESRFLG